MNIKQIKKELKITDNEIADWFGYKSAISYRNTRLGKKRLEAGLECFYQALKSNEIIDNANQQIEQAKRLITEHDARNA